MSVYCHIIIGSVLLEVHAIAFNNQLLGNRRGLTALWRNVVVLLHIN